MFSNPEFWLLITFLFLIIIFQPTRKVWKCPVCSFECPEEQKRNADAHTIEHAGHKPQLREVK